MINAGIEFFRSVDLFPLTSSGRPTPVYQRRSAQNRQNSPKTIQIALTWVGRRNEVDWNPRYLDATRIVHVKGFARPPWLYVAAQRAGGWF